MTSLIAQSKALEINLKETQVEQVEIEEKYQVLRKAVAGYKGVLRQADYLLFELHHPFKNWGALVYDLRSFSLKNFNTYIRSPFGVQACEILLDTFLKLIKEAPREKEKKRAADGLLAYMEKIARAADNETLHGLVPALSRVLRELSNVDDSMAYAIATSFHPLARLVKNLARRLDDVTETDSMWKWCKALLLKVRRITYNYWLSQDGPQKWLKSSLTQYGLWIDEEDYKRIMALLEPVSHATFKALVERTKEIEKADNNPKEAALALAELPGHVDVVKRYKEIARALGQAPCRLSFKKGKRKDVDGISIHLLFLFHMVEMEGLNIIHEEVLRQLNKNLVCLVKTADFDELRQIIPKSFALLKQQIGQFPRTALQCINALGTEILQRENTRLIELFLEQVVAFGFQTPGIQGVDTEWHVLSNPAHLQNIRAWLDLVCQKPKVCSTLLSALTINLQLGGTCIKDTDLFQRDITKLLNSDIEPIYNLVKEFARSIPVYFNEIGAEGLLRDVSTELDEISKRRDILIHFLRKQSHVESNNLIVDFIEAIFSFWYSRQKEGLAQFLPPEILEQISPYGPYVDHVHKIVRHLASRLGLEPFARKVHLFLSSSEDEIRRIIDEVRDVPPQEKRRVELLIKMYRLEYMKYNLGVQEIRFNLEEARKLGFEGMDRVLEVIDSEDNEHALEVILDEIEELKNIILSKEKFDVQETIYHKRHIAADIPSMYGKYHERKFDALGLTFRLENLANLFFERLIAQVEVPFITRSTFVNLLRHLKLLWRAVQLNGVYSKKFATYLTLLEKSLGVRRFSFTQYLDIVKGLSEGVKDMIYVYYLSPHEENLNKIIRQLWPDKLLPKYKNMIRKDASIQEVVHQVSEAFLRGLISSTFGLQHLDNFVARLYQALSSQREYLTPRELDMLLSYDPEQDLCSIHQPDRVTGNLIQLGNKGYNLLLLAEAGIPVPPAIIVTTEVFRYYSLFYKLKGAYQNFKRQVREGLLELEERSGMRFGDPDNPLLLSVRSGAAISMPGMMSTVINVGMNLEIAEGLARKYGNKWFAWDNYRRFIQSWAMSFGLEREVFSSLMQAQKARYNVEKKRQFTGEQMKELALAYREAVISKGVHIEDDPFEQLLMSIRLVLNSWDSEKARAYREIMEISDHWGTAVIIQAMAYGNLSAKSGTGVLFTANPYKKLDRVSLWGDYTVGNQGEDIVSGLVATNPISVEQSEELGLSVDESLERRFPEIYEALLKWVRYLIFDKKWTPQEIEFTFQGPRAEDLFILQTRDMVTKRRTRVAFFVPSKELERSYLGRGIGVSGGALSGKAVFTLEEIERIRNSEPETKLILIRSDTVPDDIKEISSADGILTAKGGQTSHASIVAFRLDKTCVVGCEQLKVYELEGRAEINGHVIRSGDYVSIDGRNGFVYLGKHPVKTEEDSTIN